MKKAVYFILFILSSIDIHAQVYNFPVKPGTEEWKKLKTYESRLNAYNLPKDTLKNISTERLLETCLIYPELRLIMTRNNTQEGYNYIKSIFNGLQELETRKGYGILLMKKYNSINPDNIKKIDDSVKRGRFAYQLILMELFLCQDYLLKNLSKVEKKELVKNALNIYELKNKNSRYYYIDDLSSTIRVIANILDLEKKLSSKYINEKFINYGIPTSHDKLEEIVSIAKSYIQ